MSFLFVVFLPRDEFLTCGPDHFLVEQSHRMLFRSAPRTGPEWVKVVESRRSCLQLLNTQFTVWIAFRSTRFVGPLSAPCGPPCQKRSHLKNLDSWRSSRCHMHEFFLVVSAFLLIWHEVFDNLQIGFTGARVGVSANKCTLAEWCQDQAQARSTIKAAGPPIHSILFHL